MDDERSHEHESATLYRAFDRLEQGRKMEDFVVTENAAIVSAGKDAQRSVVGGGVVQVNSNRENLFEHTRRGMRVVNTIFNRPRSPSGSVESFPERKRRVLMPNHQPVRVGRLIEERGVKRKSVRAQNFLCQMEQARVIGNVRNCRMTHYVTDTRASARQGSGAEIVREAIHLFCGEHVRFDREAMFDE